jgi:hypothetical protein
MAVITDMKEHAHITELLKPAIPTSLLKLVKVFLKILVIVL